MIQWDSTTLSRNPDLAFDQFSNRFLTAFDSHFPCSPPPEAESKSKSWFNSVVKCQVKEKNKLYQQYRRQPTNLKKELYRQCQNHLNAAIMQAMENYQ